VHCGAGRGNDRVAGARVPGTATTSTTSEAGQQDNPPRNLARSYSALTERKSGEGLHEVWGKSSGGRIPQATWANLAVLNGDRGYLAVSCVPDPAGEGFYPRPPLRGYPGGRLAASIHGPLSATTTTRPIRR
jgi:hypothetical protein